MTKRKVQQSIEKKEKPVVKVAKSINFKTLEGRFLHVKVGNQERPAETKDIDGIQKSLDGILKENNVNCIAFVSHHAVDIIIY
ncbi:MAG TPA: hypothetical protein VMV95_00520 [Bacillota bacterium]|nr:hypothetical protein [Bacillota bacterium]